MSLQSITDPSTHTKNVTPQGHVFTESFEQGTENPRIENSVITAVNMHPEGFDLIGAFFMSAGFFVEEIFLSFFHLTLPAMVEQNVGAF